MALFPEKSENIIQKCATGYVRPICGNVMNSLKYTKNKGRHMELLLKAASGEFHFPHPDFLMFVQYYNCVCM